MGKLKNRFRNRFEMVPILNGSYFTRADYNLRFFKSSVIATLAGYENLKNSK